jgi:hypothetical protein
MWPVQGMGGIIPSIGENWSCLESSEPAAAKPGGGRLEPSRVGDREPVSVLRFGDHARTRTRSPPFDSDGASCRPAKSCIEAPERPGSATRCMGPPDGSIYGFARGSLCSGDDLVTPMDGCRPDVGSVQPICRRPVNDRAGDSALGSLAGRRGGQRRWTCQVWDACEVRYVRIECHCRSGRGPHRCSVLLAHR